ncbi:MAG: DUF58 domain-containing protein [Geminicoccaceae bacterium]
MNRDTGLQGITVTTTDLVRLRQAAIGIRLGSRDHTQSARAGAGLTRFRGRGIDYAESRLYLPGDDVRTMDWRVTARTGRPHSKVFEEERDRNVLLIVELGRTMGFGTRRAYKSVVAIEAAALIAWAAAMNGDRIGAVLTSAAGLTDVCPAPGRHGISRVLQALASAANTPPSAQRELTLASTLSHVRQIARPGTMVILISDFYSLDVEAEGHLKQLRNHDDILLLWIRDPIEVMPPPPGLYPISDGVAGTVLDLRSASMREQFVHHIAERTQRLDKLCNQLGAPRLDLDCGDNIASRLRTGLAARATAQRRAAS